MNPTTEDEKKKPIIPAPVPADTQTAEVVPPVQVAAQQTTNKQVQQSELQDSGDKTATASPTKTQQSKSARINHTLSGGPGFWSERLGSLATGTPYLNRIGEIDAQLSKTIDDYRQSGRNPLADIVLAKQKPVRNVDEETRLRQNAKLHALNNMVSLIGKGVAATGGIRPTLPDNRPIYDIQNRLQRLDDIYRQEGMRYDQNTLMSALRKDQASQNVAKQAIDSLAAQRKGYVDMYKNAEDRRQKGVFKGAELDTANQKLQIETALKTAGLNETARHNRTGESLGWAKYNAANPKTLIRDYRTGKHIELTPEVQADLIGVIAQAIDQRESAKKNGGNTYVIGNGSGQGSVLSNDESGKRPLPLNNYFTDEEIKAFQKTGKTSVFSQAALARLYNDIQSGGYYDSNNEAPDYVPAMPQSGYAESVRPQYIDWIKGQWQHWTLTGRVHDKTITVE